jgi:hypothetical protein
MLDYINQLFLIIELIVNVCFKTPKSYQNNRLYQYAIDQHAWQCQFLIVVF